MPQQVYRLAVAFALVLVALIAARYFLVPDTFGDLGHYRAAALDSIAAHPKQYASHQECALCHSGIAEARLASNHRGVTCEACHGPAAAHASAPMDTKPSIPRDREFCILCHEFNPTRPTGFPQVEPALHNFPTACVTCHEPHEPELLVAPGECSACHGQIARQKAVSHHAGLRCTTCHEAPEEHKISPRTVQPTKPTERAFCGGCHGGSPGTPGPFPLVDLRIHGSPYLCWQCHYPHFPEVG
jgi:hypothetical protein